MPCPRCRGSLELISVLVDPQVVDASLRHLDVTDQPTSVHARDRVDHARRIGGDNTVWPWCSAPPAAPLSGRCDESHRRGPKGCGQSFGQLENCERA